MQRTLSIGLWFVCLLSAVSLPEKAQDTFNKIKLYRIWITPVNDSARKTEGVLYGVGDSGVWVSDSRLKGAYVTGIFQKQQVKIPEIGTIRVRRNNVMGKGIFLGLLTGVATGVAVGFMQGDGPQRCSDFFCYTHTAGEKAAVLGFVLGVAGAAGGAIAAASVRIKIPVGGDRDTYRRHKALLRKYAVNRSSHPGKAAKKQKKIR